MAKSAAITKADAVFICKELQWKGFLKSYVLAESKQAVDFGDYLRGFWDYENSPYIKEKLRKKHGIHRRYVMGQAQAAEKYWISFFPGMVLGEISWENVDAFISHLEGLPVSAKWKNRIISSGAISLKWAFHRGMIGADVSAGHTKFSGEAAERPLLTPELVAAVLRVPWDDERAKLANMLAMVTGMSKESVFAYTFHGWRHYFTAYMRDRVNEKLLQRQTGHKTLAMLDHYSDHLKAGDREQIQAAQIETFGGLIPSEAIRVEGRAVCG